jgi:two-component system, sensor histidine kinase and response regulator
MTMYSKPDSHHANAATVETYGIGKVVFLYAAFASLWILLSDRAVEWLWSDPAHITLASTLKGWLFVAVTSLLLYGLMRRLLIRPDPAPPPVASYRTALLPMGLLAVAVIAMAGAAMVYTANRHKDREVARLQAIADLRTRQIEDWMAERFGDARFVQSNRLWVELYRRWRDDHDLAARDLLQSRLNDFREYRSLESALILDEHGALLWSTKDAPAAMPPVLRDAVRLAVADQQVRYLGPYRDDTDHLHLDFIAPLFATDGHLRLILVLHVNPTDYLFATLNTWPVPSPSGETLLFRKDGDEVVFLNELRHQLDTAGKLRVPVAERQLIAAKVLHGEAGLGSLVEGVDYRNVPVMGVVRAVRGTDWFLVAKMDRAELYGETKRDALWITLAGLLSLFLAAICVFLIRQHQELATSVREREIQKEKLHALQLLDAISEGSADAIFAKDLEGRYLLFNRQAVRVVGKPPEDVLGRDDTAILPPEQAALIMANDRRVMQDNQHITFQEELPTADGETTFHTLKGPLHDDVGNVIGMYGISRDITERKRSEEQLRKSERYFSTIFHASPVAIAITRLSDHRLMDVNEAWVKVTGFSRDQAVGRTGMELNAWESEEQRGELVKTLLRDATVQDFEVRLRHRSGNLLHVLMSAELIELDGTQYMLSMASDITHRRQTEEALRESETRFRALTEEAPEAIYVQGGGRVIYSNPAMLRLLGASEPEELLDREIMSMIAPDFHAEVRSRIAYQRETGKRAPLMEQEYVRLDGSRIQVETTAVPVEFQGNDAHLVFLRDITQRKRLDEQRSLVEAQLRQAQKMEALGTLAGGIAHDFNNILGIITGYAQMACMDVTPKSAPHENLLEVLRAAHRAKELVKQILAFSRQVGQERQPVSVGLLTKETLKLLRASLPTTIEIRSRIDGEAVVFGDPTQIHQVLMNLCSNAGHAMREHGGVLEVEVRDLELTAEAMLAQSNLEPGPYVELTVKDTGCGIDAAILDRIFDPFFTTKDASEGTGLGLAVVHGIVTGYGGTIEVSSTPQNGTVFQVLLPAVKSRAAVEAATEEVLPGGTERILLVDDEPSLATVGQNVLQRLGYRVIFQTSSLAAVETFRSQLEEDPFDLVITDMTMPHMTGADLARVILRIRPDQPMIVCTGFSEVLDAEKAQSIGFQAYLMKPVVQSELAATVRRVLDGRSKLGEGIPTCR